VTGQQQLKLELLQVCLGLPQTPLPHEATKCLHGSVHVKRGSTAIYTCLQQLEPRQKAKLVTSIAVAILDYFLGEV